MKLLRTYKDNKEYYEHQLEKTLNEERIERAKEIRGKKINDFKKIFSLVSLIDNGKILCVGSRDGEEVEALQKRGYDVIGIDLADVPPYTIKMDMHDLKFDDYTFSMVYSNSLEHSYDVKKVLSEMVRVLKSKGIIFLEIQLHNNSKYEVTRFESILDITDILDSLDIKYSIRDISIVHSYDSQYGSLFYINNQKKTFIIMVEKGNE